MAVIITMTGKPRTNPRTGKPVPPAKSYKVRWYYPVPDGKAEEQTVTWKNYGDAKILKGIIEARGGRVRKTDPDVLDHSIVTGRATREDTKPFGPTVAEVIDELIAQKVKDGRKASTVNTYGCGNRAGLLREQWGTEYVSQIDEDKARGLLSHIIGIGMDHRAPVQFANAVMNFAVLKQYATLNPIKLLTMPKRLTFRPRFLAQDEFELMLSLVDEGDEFWLLMVTAWESGLRLGELLGLERDDLTIVNGTAYITVSRTTTEDTKGSVTTWLPKNGKDRVVTIPVDLAEQLLAPGRHSQRIFPALRNPRNYSRKKAVNTRYNRIVELARAGVPVLGPDGTPVLNADGTPKVRRLTGKPPRFHDLRHSHASNQLAESVDMYVLSKRLGHSSIQITVDVYGHLGKKAEDAQLRAIAAHRVPSKRLGNQVRLISVAA
jgi:integrase